MTDQVQHTFRVIGPGRAGQSLWRALGACEQWRGVDMRGRDDDIAGAAKDVDLLVIATPDRSIAEVAALVVPVPETVVAHLSGAATLAELAPHPRRASLHPLMTLPDAALGAARLRDAWWAVAGDALARDVVAALNGSAFVVDDEHRASYHAAACVASNHVVALLAQVERLAAAAGVPFDAFFPLVRASVDNAATIGPRFALTGPAARGDMATVDKHRAAIGARELPVYDALVAEIRRLVS